MSPKECFDLVTALKQAVSLPVFVHTHATTGLGPMTYLKAAEAGADGIGYCNGLLLGWYQPADD